MNEVTKKCKLETVDCIICGRESLKNDLTCLRDQHSWMTIYNASKIRKFEPILRLAETEPNDVIPNIYYHRACRATFTLKKSLDNIEREVYNEPSTSQVLSLHNTPKKVLPSRNNSSVKSRTYLPVCIFCDKETKYQTGSRTRETLIQAVDLRADQTLRNQAIQLLDQKIISLTVRDIVAAEAHYHKSCYKSYTRKRPQKVSVKKQDPYYEAEKAAYEHLYEFIRSDLFGNPRLVTQSELLSKLKIYINQRGISDLSESTKKNFRYHLETTFSTSLRYFNVDNRVHIAPVNYSFEALATHYIQLRNKLDLYEKGLNPEEEVERAAEILKDSILNSMPKEQEWPPNPDTLNNNFYHGPELLKSFLAKIFDTTSTRQEVLTWSIAQDFIYGISRGKFMTAKHLLLPLAVKTLTGSTVAMKIINRLGHGCSVTKLLEIDTAWCIEKQGTMSPCKGLVLPHDAQIQVPTVLAFDNIDRREETLSGEGTSHRVNGIIIQPMTHSCRPGKMQTEKNVKRVRKCDFVEQPLPFYTVTGRKGPPPITPTGLPDKCSESFANAKLANFVWILTRLKNTQNQTTTSWTGFNILIRDHISVTSDTLNYLPTINAPATQLSTVNEILRTSMKLRCYLNLDHIVVVLDQAIFSKAMEILWSNQDENWGIIAMMGNFHTICNFLSIIGKLFGDLGLRDLAVESGVIAEGSINKVLEGKHYNRAIRFHKLMYEACMRIIWSGFNSWINKVALDTEMHDLNDAINILQLNTCNETHQVACNASSLQTAFEHFSKYLSFLREQNGELSSFWMHYVDMVEILLGFLRANREGDWFLYLQCIQMMIPWCFALDRVNYSRYLSIHFAELTKLQERSPSVYEHFLKGGFSVQCKDKNPFSRIPIDQAIEETVNKDTQTPGGTRGFSLKKGAVSRYYINAEYRASAFRSLRGILSLTQEKVSHPDLHTTRIKKDENDVSSLADLLQSEWTNPFEHNPSNLVHLSTGVSINVDVAKDLLNAREKGQEAHYEFQNRLARGEGFHAPIKKISLKTSVSKNVVKRTLSNKEVILQCDRNLFSKMTFVAESRNLDMLEVFSHPLGPLPWTLANSDGSLKKTNKAVFAHHLEKFLLPCEIPKTRSACIIDAMCVLHTIHGEHRTFEELSQLILLQVLNIGSTSLRIDVVFDVYRENSIKTSEREKRGSEDGINFSCIKSGHKIICWRRLLRSGESKMKLIRFLVDSWQGEQWKKLIGEKEIFVTVEESCIKITANCSEDVKDLSCTHEEADTRMMLHAKHAAMDYPTVLCYSNDTDVLVLSIGLYHDMKANLYIVKGAKNQLRVLDIGKLVAAIGSEVVSAVIGFHSWSGCDSVSAFSGKGKVLGFKKICQCSEYVRAFGSLGCNWTLSEELFTIIEKFTCEMYSSKTKIESVNELRYKLFRAKGGQIDSCQLPPCQDTLKQHTLRANFQAGIWKRGLENAPSVPDPEGHGWIKDSEGKLGVHWMVGASAPETVLGFLSCCCSTKKCNLSTCTCLQNNMLCTLSCACKGCGKPISMESNDCEEICDYDSDSSIDSDV